MQYSVYGFSNISCFQLIIYIRILRSLVLLILTLRMTSSRIHWIANLSQTQSINLRWLKTTIKRLQTWSRSISASSNNRLRSKFPCRHFNKPSWNINHLDVFINFVFLWLLSTHFKSTMKGAKPSLSTGFSSSPRLSFLVLTSNQTPDESSLFILFLRLARWRKWKMIFNFFYMFSRRKEGKREMLIWFGELFLAGAHTARTRELSCIISRNMTLIVWVFIITRPFSSVRMNGWLLLLQKLL